MIGVTYHNGLELTADQSAWAMPAVAPQSRGVFV